MCSEIADGVARRVEAQRKVVAFRGQAGEHEGVAAHIGRNVNRFVRLAVFVEEGVHTLVQAHQRQGKRVFAGGEDDREMTRNLDEFLRGQRNHVLLGQVGGRLAHAVVELLVIPRIERHQVLVEHRKLGLLRLTGHRSLRQRAEVSKGVRPEPCPGFGNRAFKGRARHWQAGQACRDS